MLDLNKLQQKFNALFEQENAESFGHWLAQKQNSELENRLGRGTVEEISTQNANIYFSSASTPISHSNIKAFTGNTQYAMAA